MADSRLHFEDVAVGDQAPSRSHTLTRTDLVMYAGASGDFNPMHHDEPKAQAAGQPSVFGHGMFSAGFLATAVTGYVGIGALRRYKVRFAKQTWPDDELTTVVTVVNKRKDEGEHLVDLECSLFNQRGDQVVSGEATAALRSRDEARGTGGTA